MWFDQEIKLGSNNWCHSHVWTGKYCQPAELRLGYTFNRRSCRMNTANIAWNA
jgi:hypothetical protein